MHPSHYITLLSIFIIASSVRSQDCISYGKECTTHASCCGGCCFDNFCTDTFRSCYTPEDLCLQHNCPPGQECYIYQPEFRGYDAQAACKDTEKQEENIVPPGAVQV